MVPSVPIPKKDKRKPTHVLTPALTLLCSSKIFTTCLNLKIILTELLDHMDIKEIDWPTFEMI